MKTIKYLIFLVLFLVQVNLFAQIRDFCATSSNIPDILQSRKAMLLAVPSSSYAINIFFHVINRSDGTGGQTQQEVATALCTLESDYAPYNIGFMLLGTDQINNDTFYNKTTFSNDNNDDGKFDDFSPSSHTNAIDIYLFPNDKLDYGKSANIPGTALVIGGSAFGINLPSSHVLSHEIGHCLGLFHTFRGSAKEPEAGTCPELVNGSNCSTCGDYVCDTPADPWSIYTCINQTTCTWTGYGNDACCGGSATDTNNDFYNPNPNLVMSYTTPNCMTVQTAGQVQRMFNIIANSSLLQNTITFLVSGNTLLCTSTAYTVGTLPTGYSVHWTCSSNITLPEDPDVNPIEMTANGNGSGWVQAEIISSCGSVTLPQYPVIVGTPTPSITAVKTSGSGEPTTYDFFATLYASSTYNWYVNNVFNYSSSYPDNSFEWYFPCRVSKTIKCKISNACGSSSFSNSITKTGECPRLKTMHLSPNPASNDVQITFIESQNSELSLDSLSTILQQINAKKQTEVTTYSIRVYDLFGTLVYSSKKSGDSFILSLNNLKNGTYIIEVNDGSESYSQQFIIKH